MTSELPANVRPTPDRHGKIRYRFRRKGWKSAYLKGEPGSPEFHESYAEILREGPREPAPASPRRNVAPRSLDDLFIRMKTGSLKWRKKSDRTRRVQARIFERFFDRLDKKGRRYGERPVASVTAAWLERVFAGMADTPAAADGLRKNLSGLMRNDSSPLSQRLSDAQPPATANGVLRGPASAMPNLFRGGSAP